MTVAHTETCGCRECLQREAARARDARYRQRVRDGLVVPKKRGPREAKSAAAIPLADLFTTPELPGALCRGQWDLFDLDQGRDHRAPETRHAEAIALCQQCPALTACTSWVESLPPQKLPTGVLAGRIITTEEK
ncbi:hypothetical protein [Mycobacterium sp. NAZ190054]|uniref:hypothetical protein n=1 Tax=Mycobacterium sp. NAZ190054 TaxID=1747766 RepID=UPI000794FFF1|nr:hypothetical protein [Mycobacterium sp. NAZ190054]KWX67747.1 hypothetical protein ASJ79_04050 [Mycobacterium sp. NAZ190054]